MTGLRILHVVSEYSRREAIGRTIAETASRVPGEHHLLAARINDGGESFASARAVGGSLSWFTFSRRRAIAEVLRTVRPDVVHIHGGVLVPFLSRPFRQERVAYTLYAWPRLPSVTELLASRWTELRRSNVLRPRVLLTTLIGPRSLAFALGRSTSAPALSPDPDVVARLGARSTALPSGAATDSRRARPVAGQPVVLFAGRAETVRGIDTLLEAFPSVLDAVPGARLRLLLLPTAELPMVLERIATSGLADAVEVRTDPVADLADELAAAQVGVWPFKYDYTTSPPAMALAEAMAVGLPVVSTPVACVRSIATDGRNASLVPVGDAAALASAITALLTDPALWASRAVEGLATVADHHNWERASAATAATYAASVEQAA